MERPQWVFLRNEARRRGPRTRRLGDDRDYARGPRGPRRLGDDRRLLVRAHGSSSIRATRVLSGATPDHRGYPYPANPGAAKRVRHGCPSLATLKDYKLRESWGSGPPEWYKMKAQLWGGGSLPIGREHFASCGVPALGIRVVGCVGPVGSRDPGGAQGFGSRSGSQQSEDVGARLHVVGK